MLAILIAAALSASPVPAYLQPLTDAEVDRLDDAIAVQEMCLVFISEKSRFYLNDLVQKADQPNGGLWQYVAGIRHGASAEQVSRGIWPKEADCKAELPTAFRDAELLKKIIASKDAGKRRD